MSQEIQNRVANSGLIQFDLETYYPQQPVEIDIKDQLWQGIALKEETFRTYIKNTDWSKYKDQTVLIYCSVDAIIPTWAYMLITSALQPFAHHVHFGHHEDYIKSYFTLFIEQLDLTPFIDQRIVIKGCSTKQIPMDAYIHLTHRLRGVCKAIMYGEPCSTVPIFKKPRK